MKKTGMLIREIFSYRAMIAMLVKRNLRGRYKASVLGFAWTFINPLLQLLVYTLVFSVVMRSNIEKYYLFLFVALIPWIAMSSSVLEGANAVTSQSSLVTKIHFPRQVLPITAVTTCFVNMLLCMLVVLGVCFVMNGLNFSVLIFLVPIAFVEYLLALGIAFFVSGLNVYFRDLEHILGVFVMAWQFLSPIMYSIDQVPVSLHKIFNLNPISSIITAYRDVLYYKVTPDMGTLLYPFVISIFILFLGWCSFNRLEKHFAEEL